MSFKLYHYPKERFRGYSHVGSFSLYREKEEVR